TFGAAAHHTAQRANQSRLERAPGWMALAHRLTASRSRPTSAGRPGSSAHCSTKARSSRHGACLMSRWPARQQAAQNSRHLRALTPAFRMRPLTVVGLPEAQSGASLMATLSCDLKLLRTAEPSTHLPTRQV